MPLRMVVEVNQSGKPDMHSPRIYCDHCRSVIETAANGEFYWNPDEARSGGAEVWFVHNQCADAFGRDHESITYSKGLEMLPFYLKNVLSADMERAENDARFWAMLGI